MEKAFREAIHSIYAPETVINLANDPFQSPVAVFQALQLSSNTKTFINMASMDEKLNPLQFMMQLRGSAHLLKNAAGSKGSQEGKGSNYSMYVPKSITRLH